MIYVIGCDPIFTMKIGYTAENPDGRLASLQTANPFPLRLVAVCAGEQRDERELHARLHEHRIRGEWFWMDDESLDALERCGVFSVDGQLLDVPGALTVEAAAEWLNISVARMKRWRADGDGPPCEMIDGRMRYDIEKLRTWESSVPQYRSTADWRLATQRLDPDLGMPPRAR